MRIINNAQVNFHDEYLSWSCKTVFSGHLEAFHIKPNYRWVQQTESSFNSFLIAQAEIYA